MKDIRLFAALFFCVSLICAHVKAESAAAILSETGMTGGIVVCIGADDPELLIGLAPDKRFLVHCIDADASKVEKARQYVQGKGLYGQISVDQFDGKTLPYASDLINLVVVRSGNVPEEEVFRVLCPLGTAYQNGKTTVKRWPEEIDEWGHFLNGPDNNAVAQDTRVGLPRNLQWVDGTPWARSHEELSTISAAVTSGGRLFYIVDQAPHAFISFEAEWKLVARDAFNGILLWERSIPKWNDHMRHFRSGPAHLPRRLAATKDKVYVTLGLDAPLAELDAVTGKTLQTYKDTEWCEEVLIQDDVLYVLVGSSETSRIGGGLLGVQVGKDEPAMRTDRYMAAIDATSGKQLWRKNAKGAEYILPLGMALCGERLYFHNVQGLGCLEAKTGKSVWFVKRETLAARFGFSTSTLVATPEVVFLVDRLVEGEYAEKASNDINWAIHGWKEGAGIATRKGASAATAYAAADGKELWKAADSKNYPNADCLEGYNSPVDVFVIDNIVWFGNPRATTRDGYDLKTGKVLKTIDLKGKPVGMAHPRCYRNKASTKYLFSSRDGIEVSDFEKGWIRNNSWTRGPCSLGIMPANGLIYVPPDPCACHLKTRMPGYKAYSSTKLDSVGKTFSPAGRLQKGPAYDRMKSAPKQSTTTDADWPMHRKDIKRSGATASRVNTNLTRRWTAKPGGKLTQPVIADGRVIVASSKQNTVYAYDETTGKPLWNFVAGGRIDSSPTLHKGRVVFGCGDGKVYCLDAATGALAWAFRAAPQEWLISSFGRLASTWPVHGSVLVIGDDVCFTAGTSSYLSGGIYFYRLRIDTGEVLAHSNYTNINPKTEEQIGGEYKFDGPGVVSDILSSDGESIFLKHLQFDLKGKEDKTKKPRLMSITSLLEEEWFIRSYWVYTKVEPRGGYFNWANAAYAAPSGRILAFDSDRFYGYGREMVLGREYGHHSNIYHLFCSNPSLGIPPETEAPKIKPPANSEEEIPSYNWSRDFPLTVRAMTATPDTLVVAGVPFMGKRETDVSTPKESRLEFTNPEEAIAAFRGEKGAFVQFVANKDGKTLSEIKLPAPPVHDGMSIANGKIFISLKDGTLQCLSQ
jgi:outer membrane protein assembly factor BamB